MLIQQVVVTGKNEVELQSRPLSTDDLAPHELLIETECTFISAGTELANYTAKDPTVFTPGSWNAYPWRSGYANVGIVREVGSAVDRAGVGDRVFTYGKHGSLVRYGQDRLVAHVPTQMDPAIAAASRMAAVSLTALNVAEIAGNPWVAIFGLGAVGNLAAQAFRARGCRVIGIDPVDARRALAEQCGIEWTIGGAPDGAHRELLQRTDGNGANITVDAVGHSAVALQAVRATADHGQHIVLGSPRVPVEGDLTEIFRTVHMRWLTLRGALEWSIPMYPAIGDPLSQWSKQQMIFDWIGSGRLKLEPLISHTLAPACIKDAYEGLLHRPQLFTGVVLDWRM